MTLQNIKTSFFTLKTSTNIKGFDDSEMFTLHSTEPFSFLLVGANHPQPVATLCSLFSRENGHLLLICSSLSTAQSMRTQFENPINFPICKKDGMISSSPWTPSNAPIKKQRFSICLTSPHLELRCCLVGKQKFVEPGQVIRLILATRNPRWNSPVEVGSLSVYPVIYRVLYRYIPGG